MQEFQSILSFLIEVFWRQLKIRMKGLWIHEEKVQIFEHLHPLFEDEEIQEDWDIPRSSYLGWKNLGYVRMDVYHVVLRGQVCLFFLSILEGCRIMFWCLEFM